MQQKISSETKFQEMGSIDAQRAFQLTDQIIIGIYESAPTQNQVVMMEQVDKLITAGPTTWVTLAGDDGSTVATLPLVDLVTSVVMRNSFKDEKDRQARYPYERAVIEKFLGELAAMDARERSYVFNKLKGLCVFLHFENDLDLIRY